MGARHYTAQELTDIYRLRNDGNGMTLREVSGRTGASISTLNGILRRINLALKTRSSYKSYRFAAKMIKQSQVNQVNVVRKFLNLHKDDFKEDLDVKVEPSQIYHEESLDHFEKFKRGFENFEKEIAEFVEAEIDRRVGELRVRVLQLEGENEKLKRNQEIIKNSNFVDTLKTRWLGK